MINIMKKILKMIFGYLKELSESSESLYTFKTNSSSYKR